MAPAKINSDDSSIGKKHLPGVGTIMDLFDIGPWVAVGVLTTVASICLIAIVYFVHSAPPSSITISTGPEGSVFQKNAMKYAKILERNGVKVNVLPSEGSLENLERLSDPKSHVDVGIVQAGITDSAAEHLKSLGSISYQPMLVFYRSASLELLSELKGKKVSIGPIGSGTNKFALALLNANGIKEGEGTALLNLQAQEASKALLDHQIDAAFIMSESASSDILHQLMRSQEAHLFNFKQANAYSRKIENLNVLDLPAGAIDFGLNIPPHDISLVGPMVELIAVRTLHPALSDLLLEAATEVHNRPGVFQRRGEFPAAIQHVIPISADAANFYKSGKGLLFRLLPFWLASLITRIVVVFVPMLVVLLPAVRSIPAFFRWRTRSKILRRYRELLRLEKDFLSERGAGEQEKLREQFDRIEEAVNKMRISAAFADQFYGLRGHIDYVRELSRKDPRPKASAR